MLLSTFVDMKILAIGVIGSKNYMRMFKIRFQGVYTLSIAITSLSYSQRLNQELGIWNIMIDVSELILFCNLIFQHEQMS